ncbi:MAG: diadenylate cyclase CdaA [Clostridia bacterium]|nr:diadenylate cyclase CdaA [Clostridia bacterium]
MADFFRNISDGIMRLLWSVEWYDLIDILLVALALYYCIKFVRQTRAFNLVKGIAFLGLIYIVVSAFNMSASSFIFSQLFGDIVLVMILLFQPEIRHAIESFGRGDFRRLLSFIGKSDDGTSDEIRTSASNVAKAVSNMSEQKIGALIVVEGNIPLDEIVASGSRVDSAITTPMIENIFFPKAPLHDGALIIRDNRVHSAGCILPLTQSEMSLELGTRHRAAVGMSESSDALIIVASEETGQISVAQGGVLERNVTHGELLAALTDFLVTEESNEKGRTFKIRRRKK